MTKAERLSAALDEFIAVSPDVEASAIVSADGLPIASALPVDVEEDRLAAMSAALLTLGDKAAEGLGKGDLGQVFVEGTNGYVVLMAAGPHAVLVAVTSKQVKVGLVLYEMRKAAADIATTMEQPSAEIVEAETHTVMDTTPPTIEEAVETAQTMSRPEPSVASWQ